MFTYSRASAYTLAIVLLIVMLKSKYRFVFAVLAICAGIAIIPFIPEKWLARQQSVMTYEEDGSAMSRIDNWWLCWKLVNDRPLTGAGFYYMTQEVFAKYEPDFLIKYGGKVWDSHNVLMGMLATHGFPGFIAFLMMIGFSVGSCSKVKRLTRKRPELQWANTYAEMIQLSFLAFMINGMFANMEYFDLLYFLVAGVAALRFVVSQEITNAIDERPEITTLSVAEAAS